MAMALLYQQPQYHYSRPKPPFPWFSSKIALIERFTKRVIRSFKGQAKMKQFAFINLWSGDDCLTNLESVEFYPSVQVDKSRVSMPELPELDNYEVARPKGKSRHTEKTLMAHLDFLYFRYLEENDEAPACLFLYSWLMPCAKCTDLIIRKLSQPPFDKLPVVIVFTNPYNEESEEIADSNRQKFLRESFEVYRIHPSKDIVVEYSITEYIHWDIDFV